jgi:uncharacterized OsmC-like protein
MDDIRVALEQAVAYVTQHPDEARYTDSAATARSQEGLRIGVSGPGAESVVTDMPESVGGTGSAPSPGWLFRAALAGCEATLIKMRASQVGIDVTGVTVTVASESDDRGILGIDPAVPAGPLAVTIQVQCQASQADAATVMEIVQWAHEHCPVVDAVRRAVPVTLEVAS